MFLNVNLRLIFSTLPMLPSHVSSPRLRITFRLHMARYKFYIVLYCIVLSAKRPGNQCCVTGCATVLLLLSSSKDDDSATRHTVHTDTVACLISLILVACVRDGVRPAASDATTGRAMHCMHAAMTLANISHLSTAAADDDDDAPTARSRRRPQVD